MVPASKFKTPKGPGSQGGSMSRPKSPFERTRLNASSSSYSSEEERLFVENLVELVGTKVGKGLKLYNILDGSPLMLLFTCQPNLRLFRTISKRRSKNIKAQGPVHQLQMWRTSPSESSRWKRLRPKHRVDKVTCLLHPS